MTRPKLMFKWYDLWVGAIRVPLPTIVILFKLRRGSDD